MDLSPAPSLDTEWTVEESSPLPESPLPAVQESPSFPILTPCSICLHGLGFCGLMIRCGHLFHEQCILRWFREGNLSCPECRESYEWQDAFDIASTAHRHQIDMYDRLNDLIIPCSLFEGATPPLGSRCIVCRNAIDNLFDLFIPSGYCRHFFHMDCAIRYFIIRDESTDSKKRLIEKMLVESDYCCHCIRKLDLNTFQRLERMCRLSVCRDEHVKCHNDLE